jgi:hypothetical protein
MRAYRLQRVGYEVVDQAEEARHVRQFSVRVEGRLADPLRVNEVDEWIARGC